MKLPGLEHYIHPCMLAMIISTVEFQAQGYKIRQIFVELYLDCLSHQQKYAEYCLSVSVLELFCSYLLVGIDLGNITEVTQL